MVSSKLLVRENSLVKDCLKQLDEAATGVLFVVDIDNKLIGSLSDGDIRRGILSGTSLGDSIRNIYHKKPQYIQKNYNKDYVRALFLNKKIELLPIVDTDMRIISTLNWEAFFGNKVEKNYPKIDFPVVIMAGGKGTRMEPFTKVLPKPLIPVGDKTMVEYIIEEYRKYGINEFYMTINYKGNMIKAYFDGIEKDYKIIYLEEAEFLGTAGSLKLIKTIPETCICSNCDISVRADYKEVLDYHNNNNSVLTILSSIQHFTIPYGVVEFSSGGVVTGIKEKPEHSIPINTGVYVLSREVWKYIPDNKFFHMTHLIEALIKDGKKVMTYPVNEKDYIDIGQWDDYRASLVQLGE